MRKVWAIFLVPVLVAGAAAAVISWLRPGEPGRSRGGGAAPPRFPVVTGYTRADYTRYRDDPAHRDRPGVARRRFLQEAAFAGQQLTAYAAVDPDEAAEAFRELARETYRRVSPRAAPAPAPSGPAAAQRLRELVAAHEARCGPDPDPATGLYKGFLRLWDGAVDDADRLFAAALGRFPAGPDPLAEGGLARAGRAEACARSGRWREAGTAGLPAGVAAEAVFRFLGGEDGADDAGRFLDLCAGRAPDDPALARCRAVYEYRRGRYAECLAAADRFLAAVPGEGPDRREVGVLRAKALARLGRTADADAALAAVRGAGQWESVADRTEFLIALVAGDEARADRLLAAGRVHRVDVYQDREFGPLMGADRYAGLRKKYPPQATGGLAAPFPVPADQ